MVLSMRVMGDRLGVVKRGFSERIRVPWAMLMRAMRPLPLPGTVWIVKSGKSNSLIGWVPDTLCARAVGISGSSG